MIITKTAQGFQLTAVFCFSIAVLMLIVAIVAAVHAREPIVALYPLSAAAIFFFVGLSFRKLGEKKA